MTLLYEMPFIFANEDAFIILFYLQLLVVFSWFCSDRKRKSSSFHISLSLFLILLQLYTIFGPPFQFIHFTLLFSPLVNIRREVVRGLDSKQSSPTNAQGASAYIIETPLLTTRKIGPLLLAPCAPSQNTKISLGLGCVTLRSGRMKGISTPSPPYAHGGIYQ